MPKYWGKQIVAHNRFPEVGQKQKTEKKKREREKERLNDGNNNSQAMHGARKHAWRTQAAWAKRKKVSVNNSQLLKIMGFELANLYRPIYLHIHNT